MLADALSSELFKLWRNKTTWFWGFCFAPIVALAIGVGTVVFIRYKETGLAAAMPEDIARQTVNGVSQAASPLTMLFILIAAGILFGGEYRWETWRLLAPRSSRANLLGAKFLTFAAGAAFTVLAIGAAAPLTSLLNTMVNHTQLTWSGGSALAFLVTFLEQFLISWAQLLQVGAVAALAAVVTRSILAAVIAPIVLGVVQAALTNMPQGDSLHPSPWRLLELPGLSADMLRAFLNRGLLSHVTIDPGVATQAAISLLGWIVIAMTVALVTFRRQDLAKE
jgi:ABC-2 type transport system permease protein